MKRMMVNQSRRDFLKVSAAAGGGLMLEFSLPLAVAQGSVQGTAQLPEVTAWIVIHPDDRIVIRVARSEMGQGSSTGLAMLVAEELECDWSKVSYQFASPNEHIRRNRVWGSMATGGSIGIRGSHDYLRKAGASAREMLVAAAAQQWQVPAAECAAERSVVTHAPSGRKLSYGQVARAASALAPPKDVKLKEPRDWKLIGKPVKRLDIPASVTGAQIYAVDVRLPGMVHAAIAQCPVFGGKPKSVDAAKVRGMRGVIKVVTLDDAVVVVADNWWRAQQALKALPVTWDEGANGKASTASIVEFVRGGLEDAQAVVARREGDMDAALAGAARVIEAEYLAPFLAHATMEPMNCTAWVRDGRVDVWAPTQNAESTLATAAAAAGVPQESVEVHKVQLGGGFGRRGFQDYARQAVTIAMQTDGKPVKLMWSREEDMQHDFYRPMTAVRFKAGFDAAGKVTGVWIRDASHSIMARVRPAAIKNGVDLHALGGLADLPYSVPSLRVEFAMRNSHVPVGFWRTVFQSQNPFFRECFIDEMAHAAGQDPYEFRRPMLAGRPKDLGVLDAVAKAAEWGRPLPAGVHRGIAVHDSHGSYAAAVFEVSVSGKGELRIRRVVVALDQGHVVNPDSSVAQIESCVVYALTAALYGEITIRNGRVEQSNFHDYPMMRIRDMPKVEAVLVPSGGFWGGTGETPLAPLAPALVNAIFAATGKRIRSLPLKNHGITVV